MESEYTMLPFYYQSTTAKLLGTAFMILLAVIVLRALFFKNSMTLHRAPVAIAFAYITCSAANVLLTTFLYWYWALGIALVLSLVYAFTTAREVKEANSEERIGVWGLGKDIRRIRGEIFNDMPIEEQLEYSKSVKETAFSKLIFVLVTMVVPMIAILIYWALDIGYLFFPILK